MSGTVTRIARFSSRHYLSGLAAVGLLVIAACQADAPTSTRPLDGLSLAKGGSGGGGGSGNVAPTVTATDPTFAEQDTTVDVTIFGSGFTTGAKATWSLAGDTTLVHVRSTKVLSSDKLVARIEVPAGAPIASYDVEVTLSNGKKGVGAELFAIVASTTDAAFWFPLDDANLDVRSDGQFSNGSWSVYDDGVCQVTSRVFAGPAATGDAVLQTNQTSAKDRKCGGGTAPRKLTITYGPGDSEATAVFINVREIQKYLGAMPVGDTWRRGLHLNDARCNGLVWQATLGDGTDTNGADSVNVTRVDARTWDVESRSYPDNEAYCKNTGDKVHLAIRFRVVADTPLP